MQFELSNYSARIIILSWLAITISYCAEYLFGLEPCPLCIYSRFPYLILIVLSIINLSSKETIIDTKYFLLAILTAVILASYQSGVERGLFEMSALCKPLIKLSGSVSVSDFRNMLYSMKETPSCNRAELFFLKLSLAEWNLIFNLLLLILTLKVILNKTKT